MALAREDINFENIKHESDADLLIENIILSTRVISHLKDEQLEMRNEINEQKETISKLEDEIRILKKEKRWNMLWHNRLNDSIDKTQIIFGILFLINIIFTYFMNR